MPTVILTERARSDVFEVWRHVAVDDLPAADRFAARIDQAFRRAAEYPHAGRPRGDLAPGLRSVPLGSYLIFYRPLPDGIRVIRVLHGARDLDKVFHE